MIKQYKIRDINRNPELHKEVFVKFSDMQELFEQFIGRAIECGANADKMVDDEKTT